MGNFITTNILSPIDAKLLSIADGGGYGMVRASDFGVVKARLGNNSTETWNNLQAATDYAIETGGLLLIGPVTWPLAGSVFVDGPLRAVVHPLAILQLDSVFDYSHAIPSIDGLGRSAGIFILSPNASGSHLHISGVLDGNAGSDRFYPAALGGGVYIAQNGLIAKGAHRVKITGMPEPRRVNSGFAFYDCDDSSIEAVRFLTPGACFASNAGVVIEGCLRPKIGKIIASGVNEAIDLNNCNGLVTIEQIFANNCNQVIDINYSALVDLGRVYAKNCKSVLYGDSWSGMHYGTRPVVTESSSLPSGAPAATSDTISATDMISGTIFVDYDAAVSGLTGSVAPVYMSGAYERYNLDVRVMVKDGINPGSPINWCYFDRIYYGSKVDVTIESSIAPQQHGIHIGGIVHAELTTRGRYDINATYAQVYNSSLGTGGVINHRARYWDSGSATSYQVLTNGSSPLKINNTVPPDVNPYTLIGGTGKALIFPAPKLPTTNRISATNADTGQKIYDTTLGYEIVFNGTNYVNGIGATV